MITNINAMYSEVSNTCSDIYLAKHNKKKFGIHPFHSALLFLNNSIRTLIVYHNVNPDDQKHCHCERVCLIKYEWS